MKSEERINKIIDEKEQYQLKALRLEAENTALKAILTKRDESVTEQTKIILNLEAENKRLKEVIIKALKDTIIRLKKEYDMLDAIIDMKDAVIAELKAENERLKEEIRAVKQDYEDIAEARMEICNQCGEKTDYNILCKMIRDLDYGLQKEIEENDKYKFCLQEIKAISEKFIKNVSEDCINITPMFLVHKEILQKITKAEEV